MDTNSNQYNNSKDTAVLLISHGSTKPYNEEVFIEICEKFKKSTGFDTEVGYMKVTDPTIPQAIKNLKNRNENLENIIAVPVFLAPGIHTKIDIPTLLGLEPLEEDPRCPDGNYPEGHYLHNIEKVDFNGNIKLVDPIGPNERLLDIIDNRIKTALAESKLSDDVKTGILLVSHGSRLNYNKEFISKLHALFKENTNYPSDFGFMELTNPNIPVSISNLNEKNNLDRIVVVPVFIAPGMHTTHDIPIILGLLEEHHHHDHGHSHDHSHDLTKTDFEGEILYPQPICADDILIEILAKEVENEL